MKLLKEASKKERNFLGPRIESFQMLEYISNFKKKLIFRRLMDKRETFLKQMLKIFKLNLHRVKVIIIINMKKLIKKTYSMIKRIKLIFINRQIIKVSISKM